MLHWYVAWYTNVNYCYNNPSLTAVATVRPIENIFDTLNYEMDLVAPSRLDIQFCTQFRFTNWHELISVSQWYVNAEVRGSNMTRCNTICQVYMCVGWGRYIDKHDYIYALSPLFFYLLYHKIYIPCHVLVHFLKPHIFASHSF